MTTLPHIVYLTAGTDGAGHLMRGMAIGRALAVSGFPHRYTILAPDSPFSHVAGANFQAVSFRPAELRQPQTARTSRLATAIAALAPTLVILDLFWVPLVFVPIDAPIWLLLRSVPPAWLRGPVEARFDAARYERIYAMEDAPTLDRFSRLAPIVWHADQTPRTRHDLTTRLRLAPEAPIRLVVRAGIASDKQLLDGASEALGGSHWTRLQLGEGGAPFPLGPWLSAMRPGDCVVAGAGYNFYWESHHFGFYPCVRWVPLPRRIDDQAWRATRPVRELETCDGATVLAAEIAARCKH